MHVRVHAICALAVARQVSPPAEPFLARVRRNRATARTAPATQAGPWVACLSLSVARLIGHTDPVQSWTVPG